MKPLQAKSILLSIVTTLIISSAGAEEATSLFNGQDLSGWAPMGTLEAFTVKDGAIYTTGASPYPSWLRSEKEYENFVLNFEYRTEGWYEGGFLIHAPLEGPASKIGIKMHLRHDPKKYGMHSNGAIYNVLPPQAIVNKPSGEWNQCEIYCNWPTLRITMNGTVIQDVDMGQQPELRDRLRRGYLGIQNIGCRASFRNITLQELPDREKWKDLFGEGMDALQPVEGTQWNIEDGVLIGKGKSGYLITKEKFEEPFEFQSWIKSVVNGNGGLHFRWNGDGHGIEVQVFNSPDSTNPTGSMYGISPARRVVSRDEEWFLMQVIAEGPHARILVNGELVSEAGNMPEPFGGSVGFQQHTDGHTIWYKNARIKSLK